MCQLDPAIKKDIIACCKNIMQIKSFYLAPVPEEITDLTVISTLQLKELITLTVYLPN